MGEDGLNDVDRACADERERLCCWLHDTVLQTLELIARGALRDDPDPRLLMQLAGEEADRLRDFVDRGGVLDTSRFAEAVRLVVEEGRRLTGQPITLRFGELDRVVPSYQVAELVAALREGLTNARKHAPESAVAVFAEANAEHVLVRIRDEGPGCRDAPAPARVGLRRCVLGRLARIGGRVAIEAAPGAGTLLTLELLAS